MKLGWYCEKLYLNKYNSLHDSHKITPIILWWKKVLSTLQLRVFPYEIASATKLPRGMKFWNIQLGSFLTEFVVYGKKFRVQLTITYHGCDLIDR